MITKEIEEVLTMLEESSSSEALAVADCLRTIAEGDEEGDEIDAAFLADCADAIKEWAKRAAKALRAIDK